MTPRLPVVAADRLLCAMEPFAINEIQLVVDFEDAPDPAPLAAALRRLLEGFSGGPAVAARVDAWHAAFLEEIGGV